MVTRYGLEPAGVAAALASTPLRTIVLTVCGEHWPRCARAKYEGIGARLRSKEATEGATAMETGGNYG
jgi:hypothetical protein